MRIDAHNHFWNYSSTEYGWIDDGKLRRDFGPADLKPLIDAVEIDGVISVQARRSPEENRFLLAHAKEHDWIKGVIGYIDLARIDVIEAVETLAVDAELLGIREVLQDMEDDAFCLREDFNRGVRALKGTGLVYEILVYHRQLPNVITFVDRHPEQCFVLDHVGKPEITDDVAPLAWKRDMLELGRRENVFCKLSGLVTEVADGVSLGNGKLRSYVEVALEAFSPKRLMFGSDWPVCLSKINYVGWSEMVDTFLQALSVDERAAIRGGTACHAYGISAS